jgi:hypothetical protein
VTGRWSIQASPRCAVIGIYRDRDTPTWRIYLLPFLRLSWERPR